MSILWTTDAIEQATEGRPIGRSVDVSGIAIDSRRVQQGDLFVALHGETDGHLHVGAAFARGATAALVDHLPDGLPAPVTLVLVQDTTQALAALGAGGRARFSSPVIAVTGSVGKTTTKEMLLLCLSTQGAAHAAEASHNNHWGVPLTLARLPLNASACIVEIGMNHAGEIAPLAQLTHPDVAVITTIGAAHIGHLGSIEAIADEKASIVAGLAHGGTAIFPADTALLPRLRRAAGDHKVLTFGTAHESDARLVSLVEQPDHSEVTALLCGKKLAFRLGAPGRHMALNALAALLATHAAGMDVDRAAASLAGFAPGAGRGAIRPIRVGAGQALLLDESYNASASSIRAAFAVLSLQPATRRIVVLGDMLELGDHAEAEHQGLADDFAATSDLLFTCGPHMRLLFGAIPAGKRGLHAADAAALGPLVAQALRPGDAILVKGSNGSRMRLVVQALEALGQAPEAAA